ncbi:efflux RND transporter permease subunit [Brytella acorum]|uniref:Efflux RND transporter permease subunit n=1 Tax=Brytella acorum TaxID=2959299 RepID=A0AA35VFN9_9PROT|nr:efflux RND transporter permease subunit [Brytella acorum]CAI9122329.1 efflux RND transporter permease subunit [Brytella acorum]
MTNATSDLPASTNAASTETDHSKLSLLGTFGLISKHGILMVEFANELLHRDHLDRITAIRTAAGIRFRPIIMTTGAMVVELLPLVMASDAGANSRFGLVTVIVVGMIVGTTMTLFVVPSVYTVIRPRHGKTV